MEVNQRRILRYDQSSGDRSFGSNHIPCSQSRKISIGVMAETPAKIRSGARKEDGTALSNVEKLAYSKRTSMKENCEGSESVVSLQGKQAEGPKQDTSPWISNISLHQETPTAKAFQFCEIRSSILQSANHVQNKSNIIGETPRPKTVQFCPNQNSILLSKDGVQKKFASVTYGRTRKMGGNMERVEEFAFADVQEFHMLEKGAEEEKTGTRSNETLRVKLWEILGTDPSQNEQILSSQIPEVGVKDLRPESRFDQKDGNAAKPRQNSDTIETDSECPNQTIRRPVTRSLNRKKASTAAESKFNYKISNRGNLSPSSRNICGEQEKNIFSFEEAEEWSRSVRGGAVNGSSSLLKSKKSESKSRLEPRKICFSGKSNPERSQQGTDRGKTPASSAKKTASDSNKTLNSHPPLNNREYLLMNKGIVEEELLPARKKKEQQEDLNSPKLPQGIDPQEDIHSSSLKKKADSHYDVNSPTFGMETPIKNCSPSSTSTKRKSIEHSVQSPAPADKRLVEEGFCSLRTFMTLKPGCFGLDARTEISDDTREFDESPIREPLPVMEKKGSEYRPSQSSLSEQDAKSSEGDPLINKGCSPAETWTPETDSPEKPQYMLRPRKRLHCQEGVEINELSPTTPSSKGTEESNELLGASDQSPDNLARAVALFSLALERFKTQMKSRTSKKSSEILASVAEGIQLQLQNIKSHIQTDIRKFTSLGKSKRKRLETKFQEQQEQLKRLCENFKEVVNQHLQDCSSTLEELEVNQIELKGSLDRQKALHLKLLLQVEEAIGIQLNDAEIRIMAVHKVARENMIQLKQVIKEFLKEGVFS